MGRTRQTESQLTDRQREVLRLIAKGHTNSEIADALGISLAGAKWHVSDLLTRFGVETRDDLAEHWADEQRAGTRLRRWLYGLTAGLPLKPALLATAGAGVAVAGIGAITVIAALGGGTDDEPVAVAAVAAIPTPLPTPVPLPAARGAIWTADEALRRAEVFARSAWVDNGSRIVSYGPVSLSRAEWLPGTQIHELGDGDRYWKPLDKPSANLWLFEFVSSGVVTQPHETTDPANFWVQVTLEDGVEDDEATTMWHRYTDARTGNSVGGGGGNFHSRRDDAYQAQSQLEWTPTGAVVSFGVQSGGPGGLAINAYVSAAGYWCVRGSDVDGSMLGDSQCEPNLKLQTEPVHYSHGGRAPQSGGLEDAFIWANTAPDVVELGIRKQGRETRYPTYAPPPESGITRKFAWLGIGSVGPEGFEVVAYDASGAEVWSQPSDPIGFPPPPPPTTVR